MSRLYILLFASILWSCGNSSKTSTDNEQVENNTNALVVKTILASNAAVKIGGIQSKMVEQKVNCTGKVVVPATELTSIHSKSEGYIESMQYLPGDFVKKGAVLFTITNPTLVEKQRTLLETKASLELAEKDYARKTALQSENATTQKAFDEALAQKNLLNATYQGLKSELQLLGINTDLLEKEQKFQSKLSVYAPQNGYVQEVLVNQGQMVYPQNKLMGLANKDNTILELQVLSKDVPLLVIGAKVQFTLPNNPQPFTATIHQLNPMLNPNTGTLTVYCNIDAKQSKFVKAGMFVNASIEVEAHQAQGIPLEAVIKEGENYFAFFVEGELLKKELLNNAQVTDNFVTFDNTAPKELVIAGAYYLE